MNQEQLQGPYTPPATALAVIRRMHERGLPEVIDATALAVAGVPDSLHRRTMAALRFLGLVTEEDRRTELFTRLGRATTEEYPALLAEIIRAAYAPVFEFGIDPAQDSDQRIEDAFRRYEPSGQRVAMARLFRGLCVEAGLAPAPTEPAARTQRAARPAAPRPRASAPRSSAGRGTARPVDVPAIAAMVSDGREDLRPLHQMIDALPAEGWWTPEKRERWLKGFAGYVDFVVETRDAPPVRLEEPSDDA